MVWDSITLLGKTHDAKLFNGFFLEFSSQSLGLWVTSVCVRVDMCVFVCIGMLCVHA